MVFLSKGQKLSCSLWAPIQRRHQCAGGFLRRKVYQTVWICSTGTKSGGYSGSTVVGQVSFEISYPGYGVWFKILVPRFTLVFTSECLAEWNSSCQMIALELLRWPRLLTIARVQGHMLVPWLGHVVHPIRNPSFGDGWNTHVWWFWGWFMDGNMALASPNFKKSSGKGLWALPGRWASCAGWARPGTCDLLWSRCFWSGWRAHFFSSKFGWFDFLSNQLLWVIWCSNLKRWMTPKRLHITIYSFDGKHDDPP